MPYNILIEPKAKNELIDACQYYSSLDSETLVDKFLNAFQDTLSILEKHPFFEIKTGNFRMIMISKFPYALIFEIIEKDKIVKILSVFHLAQDPEKIKF